MKVKGLILIKTIARLKKSFAVRAGALTVLGITGLGLIISTTFGLAYRGRIVPGVKAGQVYLGNQTRLSAKASLENKIIGKTRPVLVLKEPETKQNWEIDLTELNFFYDPTATIQKAFLIGRAGGPRRRLEEIRQAWTKGTQVEMSYEIDRLSLDTKIAQIAAAIDRPAFEPEITVEGGKIRVLPGKDGRLLDKKALWALIASRLERAEFGPFKLPIDEIQTGFGEEEAIRAQSRIEKLAANPIVLRYQDQSWKLTTEEMAALANIRGGADNSAVASQAAALAAKIDREPQNAIFRFENDRVVEFVPATDGLKLDEEETAKKIVAFLEKIENAGQFGQDSEEDSAETQGVELPVAKTAPEITTEAVNRMGIRELLAIGRSNFAGSTTSRIHNLSLASEKLNGILVSPEEIFSFNDKIGEVSIATGFQSAFVIKEGKTILDDGGGVCQVSTTLFRAALNAGLPIVERHPHSYRVSYYEQGGFGPGLDATVWIPRVDLKFKNDTANYLLIQTKIDLAQKELIFEIYGTNDGRKVETSKAVYWSQTPPPPDLYLDDPALAPGTVKQTERAIWGAKVSVDWKVVRGEEVLQDRTFFSNYKAWQAVYLRGLTP